jgi:MFS family permease
MLEFLKDLAAHLCQKSTMIGFGAMLGPGLMLYLGARGCRKLGWRWPSSIIGDVIIAVALAFIIVETWLHPRGELTALQVNDLFASLVLIPFAAGGFAVVSRAFQQLQAKQAKEKAEQESAPAA